MQQSKKITTLLAMIMLFILSTTAYADEKPSLKATVSGEKSKDGEIIVNISAEDISNLGSAEIELTYDNRKLQYVSGEMSDQYNTMADSIEDLGSKVKVAVVYEEAVNGNIPFAEAKFKILADNGQISLNVSGILADIDTYEAIDITSSNVEFAVGGQSDIVVYVAIALGVVAIIVVIFIFVKKKKVKTTG